MVLVLYSYRAEGLHIFRIYIVIKLDKLIVIDQQRKQTFTDHFAFCNLCMLLSIRHIFVVSLNEITQRFQIMRFNMLIGYLNIFKSIHKLPKTVSIS